MGEAASSLRRLRPALMPDVNPLVSLLIGQCDNWQHGNQAEMRPRMEDNMQAIERALWQGE